MSAEHGKPSKGKKEPVHVEVGQVWESCDKRDIYKRRLEILEILRDPEKGDRVLVQGVSAAGRCGRKAKVLVERLRPTSTGYRLIKTPEK